LRALQHSNKIKTKSKEMPTTPFFFVLYSMPLWKVVKRRTHTKNEKVNSFLCCYIFQLILIKNEEKKRLRRKYKNMPISTTICSTYTQAHNNRKIATNINRAYQYGSNSNLYINTLSHRVRWSEWNKSKYNKRLLVSNKIRFLNHVDTFRM
jgi:hypothetical protein